MQGGESSSFQSGFIVKAVVWVFNQLSLPTEGYNLAFWVRKTAHFTEYFILGLFWLKAQSKPFTHLFFYAIFLIPILDESIQYFTPGRVMSGVDMLIDAFGLLSGILLLTLTLKRTR